jgi:hypothetical protein
MSRSRKRREEKPDIRKLYEWQVEEIYMDNIGYVPEDVMRDFVRLARGQEQPAGEPVSVRNIWKQFLLFGRDEDAGHVIFVPLNDAVYDARVAVSVSIAGTWGRFKKLEPYRCDHMQRGISYESPHKCFSSFYSVHKSEMTRSEALRAYGALDWHEDRPPRGRDTISLAELSEQVARYKMDMHDPLREMMTTVPRYVRERFGKKVMDKVTRRKRVTFKIEHEEAILATLNDLGFTTLRDQFIIDCFLGRVTDRELADARAHSYERISNAVLNIECGTARRHASWDGSRLR